MNRRHQRRRSINSSAFRIDLLIDALDLKSRSTSVDAGPVRLPKHKYAGFWLLTARSTDGRCIFVHPSFHLGRYFSQFSEITGQSNGEQPRLARLCCILKIAWCEASTTVSQNWPISECYSCDVTGDFGLPRRWSGISGIYRSRGLVSIPTIPHPLFPHLYWLRRGINDNK